MGKTNIEWTEQTWNPVTGCTKISAGCKHCYAAAEHGRRAKGAPVYKNGHYRPAQYDKPFSVVQCHPGRLRDPMRRRKPTIYFVCSGSDVFHQGIPSSFLGETFATMVACPRHRFLVLTKRSENVPTRLGPYGTGFYTVEGPVPCPQPNIAIGTSCENQATADERIPHLLNCPAAMHFLSLEPLLGPIPDLPLEGIDWVIVGCESGLKRRIMRLPWVRDIRDQCVAAGVPFFFKQAFDGELRITKPELDGRQWVQEPAWLTDWRNERDGTAK